MLDSPFFQNSGRSNSTGLIEHAIVSPLPKKALFFSEATTAHGMHILLTGKVKLFKVSEEGKEQTIFILGPGEPFCLCSVFCGGRLPGSLAALEDSEILFISPREYEHLMREDPSIMMNMMRVMSRRLKEAMDLIDSLSLKQVPSRLAAYFLSREKDGKVTLDVSYRELSKIIGITPEALSRVLKKMTGERLIQVEGSNIYLKNRAQLADAGDGRLS